MKILITGGAGYVGCSLVQNLVQRDDVSDIIIYDNLSTKNYNLFTSIEANSKIRFLIADILDNYTLRKALEDIDVVYHLAAVVHNPESDIESHTFEQVNHWGSALVVDEVSKSNVRKLIYVSTSYVYGQQAGPIDEGSQTNPNSFYAYSKLRGEEQIDRLPENIDSYIIRSGSVFGYNSCCRFDVVVNKLIFEAKYYGKVAIHGNGEQIRPFVHVSSLAAHLSGILDNTVEVGISNLVDYNLSINDVVQELKTISPELEYSYVNQHIQMGDILIRNLQKTQEGQFHRSLEEFYKKLL